MAKTILLGTVNGTIRTTSSRKRYHKGLVRTGTLRLCLWAVENTVGGDVLLKFHLCCPEYYQGKGTGLS